MHLASSFSASARSSSVRSSGGVAPLARGTGSPEADTPLGMLAHATCAVSRARSMSGQQPRAAAMGIMPSMKGSLVKAMLLRYQPTFLPVTGSIASGQMATLVHWYLPCVM